jgi:hypothetical protein
MQMGEEGLTKAYALQQQVARKILILIRTHILDECSLMVYGSTWRKIYLDWA